jgi:pimeloyl-ACP methyl ester carboxylesterase
LIGRGTSRHLSRHVAFLCIFLPAIAIRLADAQESERVQTVSFDCHALAVKTTFTIVKPEAPPGPGGYAVLIILHGLGRNQRTLLDQPETRDMILHQQALLVLPDSGRGWWIDSPVGGAKYDSMLMEVVGEVRKRFPVSTENKQWGVIGWSMGGFGAMHFAENHPEVVNFVGSIIGLLDYPRVDGLPEDQRFPISSEVFGTSTSGWALLNPSLHTNRLTGKRIVIVIGNQAFDRTMNENFLHAAMSTKLPVEAYRIDGSHTFPTVVSGLDILLERARESLYKSLN